MENLNLEATVESKVFRALAAVENQRLNLETKGKALGVTLRTKILRSLTAGLVAGASLLEMGCGAKEVLSSDTQTPHQEDRFERAERKMDQEQAERDKVRTFLKDQGFEVKDSDTIGFQKLNGQLSLITVNGQEVWKDSNNQKPLVQFEQGPTGQQPAPEQKTNPDAANFL